jgi:DNA-directed RNA polymerase, beta subunit/140 kD subunit
MYDGRTGKKFNAEVYVGVVYYQKASPYGC